MSKPLKNLLMPGKIGNLEIRNRIFMTPMGTNQAQPDGHCGERIQRYYEERAKGGVGLVIVGVGSVSFPAGACNPNQVAISRDEFLPGLQALAERVHAHGAKVAIQLQHAGHVAIRDIAEGRAMLGPSIPAPKKGDLMDNLTPKETQEFVASYMTPTAKIEYKEATQEDINLLIADFANAAERAKRAGFDAVEIHGGHGYIISSFLSRRINKRSDQYGGGIENRSRLLVEVIQAVKARVGKDFPVWCRLDAEEFRTPNGIILEDAKVTAQLAEQAGADAIHVTAYADATLGGAFTEAPLVHKPAGYVDNAAAIKSVVTIPIIAVGRIEPELADKLIADKKIDFVAMGRKLLADPELPLKLKELRAEDIRPCIYCYTCVGEIFLNRSVRCAVNPATGKENEFDFDKAAITKKVLVIGGGPAGMETARLAALRGHQVTLLEKSKRLGGTVFFSSVVYPENGLLIEYLEHQIRQLPIDIRLETEATAELIDSLNPQVVVLAVGAKREAPDLPGVELPHVLTGDDLRAILTGEDKSVAKKKLSLMQRAVVGVGGVTGMTASAAVTREMSKHWMPLGDNIVIVGGGLVGVELAEFLLERKRNVVILEESNRFGIELPLPRRWRILEDIQHHGVKLVPDAKVVEINREAVVYQLKDGSQQTVNADQVILAIGTTPNLHLADAIKSLGMEIHTIGDCTGVGYIDGAMNDAARLGRRI